MASFEETTRNQVEDAGSFSEAAVSQMGDDGVKVVLGVEHGVKKIGTEDDVDVSGENVFDKKVQGYNGKGIFPNENEEATEKNEEATEKNEEDTNDDDMADQDHEFNVGDYVWGKIGNNSWWPGQIYDPSDASEYALRLKSKKGHILVAYFGDESFSWLTPDELKPFVENFAKMSEQSNSKGFVNAVQEALDAISRLLEMEMSPKISQELDQVRDARPHNDGIKEGVVWPVGGFGKYLIELYEPKELIARLRNVAKGVAIDKFEVPVLKSWLSAYRRAKVGPTLPFYNYPEGVEDPSDLGEDHGEDERCSLPVDVVGRGIKEGPAILSGDNQRRKHRSMVELMGTEPIDKGEMASLTHYNNIKSGKRKIIIGEESSRPSASRERKKSKYLSHPYTNQSSKRQLETASKRSDKTLLSQVGSAAGDLPSLREKSNLDFVTENLSKFRNSSFVNPFQKCQSNVSELKTNDEDPKRRDMPWKLLVTFPKGFSLPSREKLMEMYSKYGALNEKDTDVYYNNFTALVAYQTSSDTGLAYLESVKLRPFGAGVTYNLRYLPHASRIQKNDQNASSEKANASQPSDGEATEVGFIVEKLKMMTAMVDACDGRLSLEVKSKLEGGLKDLLEKVSGIEITP